MCSAGTLFESQIFIHRRQHETNIHFSFSKALQDPDLRKRWIDQGYVIWNSNGGELAERMRREHALWAEVTKGMKFD